MEYLKDLNFSEKLLPNKNPYISWFYCFFPALIGYFSLLTSYLNTKKVVGVINITDQKAMSRIVYPSSKIEEIVSGHINLNGPMIIESDSLNYLLYSDTHENRIYKWEEGKGFFTIGESRYIDNSGCSRKNLECREISQPGSRGLLRIQSFDTSPSINLVVAQTGDRSISLLFENGTRNTLASKYKGDRLNSPIDLVWSDQGHLYFIDWKSSEKNNEISQIDFNTGVFFMHRDDIINSIRTKIPTNNLLFFNFSNLLTSSMGLAFNPKFSRVYVTDPFQSKIFIFDVDGESGAISNGRILFDGSLHKQKYSSFGGIKLDSNGNIYVTTGEGILILNLLGEIIGMFKLGQKASNLVISSDGWLYITSNGSVFRIRTRAKPAALFEPPSGKIRL